jgi:SAM-dependent methyltransferase
LSQNLSVWGERYDWSAQGDEWSDTWGGVPYQWWTTLWPRLQGYLPARRILEIAPGYGRWTHFLRDLCDELVIVDIAPRAIEHCRERFAGDNRIRAFVNDGCSLAMVAERSIDVIFTFDSLVHAEADVIDGYMREFARALDPEGGVAFIHHSNMGAYPPGSFDPNAIHWRATSVSAALVEELARAAGLRCISQETIAWGNETLLNDGISVITPAGSRWERENVVVENVDFTRQEIAIAHRVSTQYPPFRKELSLNFRLPQAQGDARGRALAALEQGSMGEARRILLEHFRYAIDPEALTDLAVLTMHCGDPETARALLDTLVRLHPAAATQNLVALASRAVPAGT